MKAQNINPLLLLFSFSLFLFSCQEPVTQTEPDYEGPPKGHIISVERAQQMYDAYSQRRVPIIQEYEGSIVSDSTKFTPTRYAEYDLETIKQYIAYIEHEAKEAEVEIKTLRFYLSNYPNSDKFPNGDVVKYPRRNSFFVVPTMAFDGENVGFSVEEIDGKYRAVPIKKRSETPNKMQDSIKTERNEAGFFIGSSAAILGSESSLILNDSNIMPPPGSDDFGGE